MSSQGLLVKPNTKIREKYFKGIFIGIATTIVGVAIFGEILFIVAMTTGAVVALLTNKNWAGLLGVLTGVAVVIGCGAASMLYGPIAGFVFGLGSTLFLSGLHEKMKPKTDS